MSEGSPTERFGPYIVYEQLGVGGMAQVHRAVAANADLHRPVALKRMLSHVAGSEDMVKSFVREARLASYLRHENVAQTYDLGRVGDTYFIVMELITGRNLREVLRHCGATTGPMPVPVALNILNQVCDALDYAHNLCDDTGEPLGIIHRDVSPSNVLVSNTGVVKLIDFGIAKASGAGMQTMSGTLKGKFAYMAPEYIAGRIDARADLFAVGVIAHELLTNRPLFSGRDDIDTLTRVRDMRIDPPSKNNPLVPPEIDDIVMTALARDPERRWQHATALRTALTTLTRRLGLVASNAQMVQWLDWAFAQPRPKKRADSDTDSDAEPIISIEPRTASPAKIALGRRDGEPEPPTNTPLGTPAYVPAQHPLPTGAAAAAVVDRSGPVAVPRVTVPAAAPPMARASSAFPVRARSVSGAPSAQPQPRPGTPSQPPPIASPLASHPPAPGSYPAPQVPSFNAAPFAAPRPVRPSQVPLPPGTPTMPGMPAPPAGTASRPPGLDPRSAQLQREFAQRASTLTPGASGPPARRGHWPTVVLVVVAAAAAATTVYFVLPLLT
ncbi:MAG TPA: protein kinase [Kofleriaceae bacterium]